MRRDDVVEPGATAMSQRKEISYSGYLQLDSILQAQQPLSTAHDEMLFIVQHQTSELWMKLAIHELGATCRLIAADDLQPAFKTLSRVSRILEQLNSAWDVLRTMTPSEYTEFHGLLGLESRGRLMAARSLPGWIPHNWPSGSRTTVSVSFGKRTNSGAGLFPLNSNGPPADPCRRPDGRRLRQ